MANAAAGGEAGMSRGTAGYRRPMALLVILLLAALVFGVGAVIEGLLWLFLITAVLLAAAVWLGWRKLRSFSSSALGS
ncbi:hypothetical protein BDK89_0531 [Ilumatobacter fluminis]|uniref:Uncharacterized protein n=2 Tax=Ilumatobacter fluminis TaxID=467091 RepID=A0A4R7HVJ0_9ACTN|nr:hypothetical protein BDK89_0531 [Ilumatobacter fluminis]